MMKTLFQNRLINCRKLRGWSQRELAARTGLSAAAIGRMECEPDYRPGRATVIAICAVLRFPSRFDARDPKGGELPDV